MEGQTEEPWLKELEKGVTTPPLQRRRPPSLDHLGCQCWDVSKGSRLPLFCLTDSESHFMLMESIRRK